MEVIMLGDQLKEQGFCVLKDCFDSQLALDTINDIESWFSKSENVFSNLPEGRRFAIPNGLNIPFFEKSKFALNIPKVTNLLKEITNDNLKYCHHFDIHKNLSSDWHEDTQFKHIGRYSNQAAWDGNIYSEDAQNNLKIYRVAFYLEDHSDDPYGLSVKPRSHLSKGEDQELTIHTEIGDVIIFDPRIQHRGVDYEQSKLKACGKNRYAIFTAFGQADNKFTEDYIRGCIERQEHQSGKSYILQSYAQEILSNAGIKY